MNILIIIILTDELKETVKGELDGRILNMDTVFFSRVSYSNQLQPERTLLDSMGL